MRNCRQWPSTSPNTNSVDDGSRSETRPASGVDPTYQTSDISVWRDQMAHDEFEKFKALSATETTGAAARDLGRADRSRSEHDKKEIAT